MVLLGAGESCPRAVTFFVGADLISLWCRECLTPKNNNTTQRLPGRSSRRDALRRYHTYGIKTEPQGAIFDILQEELEVRKSAYKTQQVHHVGTFEKSRTQRRPPGDFGIKWTNKSKEGRALFGYFSVISSGVVWNVSPTFAIALLFPMSTISGLLVLAQRF